MNVYLFKELKEKRLQNRCQKAAEEDYARS